MISPWILLFGYSEAVTLPSTASGCPTILEKKPLGAGFDANFYTYPFDSSESSESTYWLNGFNTTEKLYDQKSGVVDVAFQGYAPGNSAVYGDIYGVNTTVSNFTVELLGYYKAETSGNYSFTLNNINQAMSFQIGTSGQGCDGNISSIIDWNHLLFFAAQTGPTDKPEYTDYTTYLEGNQYYPVRMLFVNVDVWYNFNVTVKLPSGEIQTKFENVYAPIIDSPTTAHSSSSVPSSSFALRTSSSASRSIISTTSSKSSIVSPLSSSAAESSSLSYSTQLRSSPSSVFSESAKPTSSVGLSSRSTIMRSSSAAASPALSSSSLAQSSISGSEQSSLQSQQSSKAVQSSKPFVSGYVNTSSSGQPMWSPNSQLTAASSTALTSSSASSSIKITATTPGPIINTIGVSSATEKGQNTSPLPSGAQSVASKSLKPSQQYITHTMTQVVPCSSGTQSGASWTTTIITSIETLPCSSTEQGVVPSGTHYSSKPTYSKSSTSLESETTTWNLQSVTPNATPSASNSYSTLGTQSEANIVCTTYTRTETVPCSTPDESGHYWKTTTFTTTAAVPTITSETTAKSTPTLSNTLQSTVEVLSSEATDRTYATSSKSSERSGFASSPTFAASSQKGGIPFETATSSSANGPHINNHGGRVENSVFGLIGSLIAILVI